MNSKAVFFDRDGVINKSYVIDGKPHAPLLYNDFHVLEFVKKTLDFTKKSGYKNIIITNQPNLSPDIGTLRQSELDKMHEHLLTNFSIDLILTCPHSRDYGCECRKPKIGNILLAARKFNINLSESFFVGDRAVDIECAHRAKLKKSFFIDYNYSEQKPEHDHIVISNISEICHFICK